MRKRNEFKAKGAGYGSVIKETEGLAERITLKEWQAEGKPELWHNVDTLDHDGTMYRLWEDNGYGRLAMTVDNPSGDAVCVDVCSGDRPVFNETGDVVGIGAYFTSADAVLFSR